MDIKVKVVLKPKGGRPEQIKNEIKQKVIIEGVTDALESLLRIRPLRRTETKFPSDQRVEVSIVIDDRGIKKTLFFHGTRSIVSLKIPKAPPGFDLSRVVAEAWVDGIQTSEVLARRIEDKLKEHIKRASK